MQQPHRIKLGASVVLVSLDGLAADWGIQEASVRRLCGKFGIPVLTPEPEGKQYLSLYTFERALFEALLPSAFREDHLLVQAHLELAGVMYGTLTSKLLRERVLSIARELKKGPPNRAGKRPPKT